MCITRHCTKVQGEPLHSPGESKVQKQWLVQNIKENVNSELTPSARPQGRRVAHACPKDGSIEPLDDVKYQYLLNCQDHLHIQKSYMKKEGL